MVHFQNSDIVKMYSVSNQTVINWKKNYKKLNLEIDRVSGRTFIANTPSNRAVLDKLVFERKVKDTSRKFKVVEPTPEFYKSFTDIEILDYTRSLNEKKRSDLKYTYKDGGAKYWDDMYHDKNYYIADTTNKLVNTFLKYSDDYFDKNESVVVVDTGSGNSMPVFPFLSALNVKAYMGIDISKEMNEIAEHNIVRKYPDLDYKFFHADIEHDQLIDLVAPNYKSGVRNLILEIGNTICNHSDRRAALRNLRRITQPDDIVLITFSVQNPANFGTLNYINSKEGNYKGTLPLRLFGLDVDKCDIEMVFNPELNAKQKFLTVDKNYRIQYRIFGETKEIEFLKGERIEILMLQMMSITQFIDEVSEHDFKLKSLQVDETGNNALAVLGL